IPIQEGLLSLNSQMPDFLQLWLDPGRIIFQFLRKTPNGFPGRFANTRICKNKEKSPSWFDNFYIILFLKEDWFFISDYGVINPRRAAMNVGLTIECDFIYGFGIKRMTEEL